MNKAEWLSKVGLDTLPGILGAGLSLASGYVLQYIAVIGPPPPEHKLAHAIATTIVAALAWFGCAHFLRPNTKVWIKRTCIVVFGLFAIVSGLLYWDFSWKYAYYDVLGERHAKGTVENEFWKKVTDPEFARKFPNEAIDPNLPEKDQIELYWGQDPSQRWTTESIQDNEWWMVVYWYPMVFGLAGLTSIYIATRKPRQRKQREQNAKSKPESPERERKYTFREWLVYGFWGFVLELLLTALFNPKDAGKHLVLLLVGFVSLSILVGMLVVQILGIFQPPVSDQVAQQISDMEDSIEGLRSAEKLMAQMRNDLEQANLARQRITQELETAKKVKGVTDEQVEAMAAVLKRQSWWDWSKGVVTGVVITLVAQFIISVGIWIARRRAGLAG